MNSMFSKKTLKTIRKTRRAMYRGASILGDVNAVASGKIGKRIANKILGRIFGRLWRK